MSGTHAPSSVSGGRKRPPPSAVETNTTATTTARQSSTTATQPTPTSGNVSKSTHWDHRVGRQQLSPASSASSVASLPPPPPEHSQQQHHHHQQQQQQQLQGLSQPPSKKPTVAPLSSSPSSHAVTTATTPTVVASSASSSAAATAAAAVATPGSAASRGSGGGASPPGSNSKPYKGLRHFSLMVCKKVEEKGVTTYNEVADELVQHVVAERCKEDPSLKFDEKNIRRRVYDALNVLMAMDIITKDKKAISWKGLPTRAHADLDMLQREKEFLVQEVDGKKDALRELLVQQVCFRNLVAHNFSNPPPDNVCAAATAAAAGTAASSEPGQDHKIPLPFIVVNTHSSAVIQCNMSRDLTDVMFDFSQPFEINDDNTILKRLGMQKTNRETLQEMLPEDLLVYADEHDMLTCLLDSNMSTSKSGGMSSMSGSYDA